MEKYNIKDALSFFYSINLFIYKLRSEGKEIDQFFVDFEKENSELSRRKFYGVNSTISDKFTRENLDLISSSNSPYKEEFKKFFEDYRQNTVEIQNLKKEQQNFIEKENFTKIKANLPQIKENLIKEHGTRGIESSVGSYTLNSISVEQDGKRLYEIDLQNKTLEQTKLILNSLNYNSKDIKIFENRTYDNKDQNSNLNQHTTLDQSRKEILIQRIDEAIKKRDLKIENELNEITGKNTTIDSATIVTSSPNLNK